MPRDQLPFLGIQLREVFHDLSDQSTGYHAKRCVSEIQGDQFVPREHRRCQARVQQLYLHGH